MRKKSERKNIKIKVEHWKRIRQYAAMKDVTIQDVVDSALAKLMYCMEDSNCGKED
jgi:predicted RNase H-like nuclease